MKSFHYVILLIAESDGLLNHCLALTGHVLKCLVAHERNVTVAISVPLPVVVVQVDNLCSILAHSLIKVAISLHWARSHRNHSACSTHLPVDCFVLYDLLLELLLLKVHLLIQLA